jgi:hypothetical protein
VGLITPHRTYLTFMKNREGKPRPGPGCSATDDDDDDALFFYLSLRLPSGSFLQFFFIKITSAFSSISYVLHTLQSHPR